MTHDTQRLYDKSLNAMIDSDDISNIEDIIEDISNEISNEDLYGGRTIDSLRGGAFLIACRSEDEPITAGDISDNLEDTTTRDIILARKYIEENINCISHLPTNWRAFLQKFAESLSLKDETIKKSYEIGRLGEDSGILSGRKPQSYAAASIYAAIHTEEGSIDSWVTQRALCSESETSESTIRITYQELLSNYKDNDG